jgi:hypothetical protein
MMRSAAWAMVTVGFSIAMCSCESDERLAAVSATILKIDRPNPFEYSLQLQIDSLEIISGGPSLLKAGDRITVIPNYVYISPHVLDMSREVNHSLTEIGRARAGQQLAGTLAMSKEGSWLLLDGKVLNRAGRVQSQ